MQENEKSEHVALKVGDKFEGRYEITSVLGAGGNGIVYGARHLHIDRLVALKMLLPRVTSDERNFLRFEREARSASQLTHPNIIAIHDFGKSADGTAFLVMEHVNGQSLDDILDFIDYLDLDRFWHIFSQVCKGLEHAHKRGLIHRDIKPSNLMICTNDDETDLVKIVDFGLAKHADNNEEPQNLTTNGMLIGTPLYMSPEQCRGLSLDQRSDIYSLGCVMYRSLTGKFPLEGETPIDTLAKHLALKPTPISNIAPELGIPAALDAVIMKALEKDCADRQQTIGQLAQELDAALMGGTVVNATGKKSDQQSRDTEAIPISNITSKFAAEAVTSKQSDETVGAKQSGSGNAVAASLAVVIAIGCVFYFTRPQVTARTDHDSSTRSVATTSGAAPDRTSTPKTSATVNDPSGAGTPPPVTQLAPAQAVPSAPSQDAIAAAVAAYPSANRNTGDISNQNATQDQIHGIVQAMQTADSAFSNHDYATASGLYEECLAPLKVGAHAYDPTLLPILARVIDCYEHLGNPQGLKSNLTLALNIFSKAQAKSTQVVSATGTASEIWETLARGCVAASADAAVSERQIYLKWSRDFYGLAYSSWNKPKNLLYRNIVSSYVQVLRECGDSTLAARVEQLEVPVAIERRELGGGGLLRRWHDRRTR